MSAAHRVVLLVAQHAFVNPRRVAHAVHTRTHPDGAPHEQLWRSPALHRCPQSDSNRHWADFKSAASANWAMGAPASREPSGRHSASPRVEQGSSELRHHTDFVGNAIHLVERHRV